MLKAAIEMEARRNGKTVDAGSLAKLHEHFQQPQFLRRPKSTKAYLTQGYHFWTYMDLFTKLGHEIRTVRREFNRRFK